MDFPLSDLPWWGFALITLGSTHVTIAAVTIYLHRHQAHRTLDLHPAVSHFFRFWLWLTTGTVTREWVAVHRKHHAKCDTDQDPHSPVFFGICRVLFDGAGLYRREADNPDTLAKYGQKTPDDWVERHVYSQHSTIGIGLLLIAEVLLFGGIGLTIWAVQMMWIPLVAAGLINGIGHFWGYRGHATSDASRNILPWGILAGGEELHNNHHAHAASARLSNRQWEFDLGWTYIRLLETLGLATVRKVAPMLRVHPGKTRCDADTVHAIISHRFTILANYARALKRTVRGEFGVLRSSAITGLKDRTAVSAIKHWLQREGTALPPSEQEALHWVLRVSPVLQTIYTMRQELAALWNHSTNAAAPEQLVRQLEGWCQRAEASGIAALQQFSQTLRCYG